MSILIKNIIRFALFILVQVYILFQVPPLHEYVVPYLYFLYILWLPFKMPRISLMLLGFVFGFSLDYFTHTPGLHAAPCILIAYVRPFLINLLIPQEGTELNYASPSVVSMGWAPYATYVTVLTLLHHAFLIFLEWLHFGSFVYFILKLGSSAAVSLLLIFITELLFFRKERFRTNTA